MSPTTELLLSEKRCLVTGGTRGLGLEICLAFAEAGAKVAFTYSNRDQDAEDAYKRISQKSPAVLKFKGSVADAQHVKTTVKEINTQWGGVDILVNNVGITQILPIALLEEKDWDHLMDINVKGPYLFSRAVLKHMIRVKQGHILNIGTFASERFIESPIHYATSKSALRGFTEALSLEVGRHNIQVNLLSPGLLDVGLSTMIPQHRLAEYKEQCATKRLGTAKEVAQTAVFLVSSKNTFMTGAKVVIDGGI